MAEKILINCEQVLGVTGVALATSNALTTSGTSQEIYEGALTADWARFYLDITAVSGTGTITFALNERSPGTGTFFRNADKDAITAGTINGTSGGIFNTTGFTGTTSATATVTNTISPLYTEALQVAWTITGFTSVTCSLLAQFGRTG